MKGIDSKRFEWPLEMMDFKRLKKIKREVAAVAKSPARTEIVCAKNVSSPDLPVGSQECFKVGWDWSEDNSRRRPKIKFVDAAPRTKRLDVQERLQCLRPRRLLPSPDPPLYDASSFINDLKSLASSSSRSSPAATNFLVAPSSGLQNETAVRCTLKNTICDSKSITASSSNDHVSDKCIPASPKCSSDKDSLNDLLEDSMCEEIVKCTQDLESKMNNVESPVRSEKKASSSCKKKKLSLSLKRKSFICRRLENADGSSPTARNSAQMEVKTGHDGKLIEKSSSVVQRTPSRRSPSTRKRPSFMKEIRESVKPTNAQFDDDDVLNHFLAAVEKEETPSTKPNENCRSVVEGVSLLDSDDFLVSPDVLGLIDQCEKKATQELDASHTCSKSTSLSKVQDVDPRKPPFGKNVLDPLKSEQCSITHKTSSSYKKSELKSTRHVEQAIQDTKTDRNGHSKCTPQEIEQKRIQAIRKRLSLRKCT